MTTTAYPIEYTDELQRIEHILLPHRQFQEIVQRLTHAHELALGGVEPRHTLLVGESGSGKTWIARYMQSRHPDENRDGFRIKRVLYVSTPSPPTLKTLAQAVLASLDDPLAGYGTADAKRYRALALMDECGVEMLIIDELQHFLDHRARTSMYGVADWLKAFIDDAGIPCLLMGLPRATEILAINEQLRRRFATRLELLPFSIETEDAETEFRSVLNELDRMMPTSRRSGFAEVDLARRMFVASNGLMGYLKKLIVGAFDLMRSENRSYIDADLLGRAFEAEIWRGSAKALNPFHPKFTLRKLDRPGEPFGLLCDAGNGTRRAK